MKGLRIDVPAYSRKFTSVFGSMLDDFSRHYWFIDGYGPFSTSDKANFRELDTELERYSVEIYGIDYGPPGLWKPGTLPWAAELLVVDEGTTLVGILGDETKASALAAALDRELSNDSASFLS